MTSDIEHSIGQLTDLTESEITEFTKIARIKTFERKSNFIREGQIPTEFGFVLSGLFRYLYI